MDGEINTREAPIQRLPKTSKQFSDDFYAILYPSDEQAINAVSFAEQKAQRQAALARYVDLQIQEKDRYNRLFKTEQGSVYFIFDTGESVRVKCDKGEWKIQPRCKKIVYVDEAQCEQLLQILRAPGPEQNTAIIGQPIRTLPLAEGVRPFEFGVAPNPAIDYSEEHNTLRILGDETGVFASGWHLGHPVVEIVK